MKPKTVSAADLERMRAIASRLGPQALVGGLIEALIHGLKDLPAVNSEEDVKDITERLFNALRENKILSKTQERELFTNGLEAQVGTIFRAPGQFNLPLAVRTARNGVNVDPATELWISLEKAAPEDITHEIRRRRQENPDDPVIACLEQYRTVQ